MEEIARTSGFTPTPLLEKPTLAAHLYQFYTAFIDVNESRPEGAMGGTRAIPVSEIESYLNLQGIVGIELRRKYFRVIRKLDLAYRKWAASNKAGS